MKSNLVDDIVGIVFCIFENLADLFRGNIPINAAVSIALGNGKLFWRTAVILSSPFLELSELSLREPYPYS